jgi:hypothetical protein
MKAASTDPMFFAVIDRATNRVGDHPSGASAEHIARHRE